MPVSQFGYAMMLNKLTSIPTILRLFLCLLVSTGVHGGVAYYDWANQPARVADGQSAVVVELVAAAGDPPFTDGDSPQVLSEQDSAIAERKVTAEIAPAVSSRPVVNPPRMTRPKPEPVKDAVEIVKEPAEEVEPTAPVCVEPRQSVPEPLPEIAAINRQVEMALQGQGAEGPVPGSRVAQPGDHRPARRDAARPTGEALTEALPDYLNNPLPEYPYIARQRHWEGVVWLLVDVSAQGLVDDIDVERSCGYRVLDRAASRTVKRWEFTPATRAGLPVESRVRIPVRFNLKDS